MAILFRPRGRAAEQIEEECKDRCTHTALVWLKCIRAQAAPQNVPGAARGGGGGVLGSGSFSALSLGSGAGGLGFWVLGLWVWGRSFGRV